MARASYPPVFPMFLAPLIKIWGLNFAAMKLEQVLFLLLALVTIYFCWKLYLDFVYLFALIAILGFNPRLWAAKDNVLSDLPFLLFFYVTVLLLTRAPRDSIHAGKWAFLSGLALYLCIGTRAAGLTLIPSVAIYDCIKHRKITRFSAFAVFVCGTLLALQRYVVGPGQDSYLDQLHPTFLGIAGNFASYARSLGTFWLGISRGPSDLAFLGLVGILSCVGLYFHFRRGTNWIELFLIPYLVLIVVWPSRQGLRFLLPVVPFVVYLSLIGLARLTAASPRRLGIAGLAGFVMLTAFSYTHTYRDPDFADAAESEGFSSFEELCQTIRTTTAPEDVFICRMPRALSLFTSRSAGVYATTSDAALLRFIDSIHATHIVTSSIYESDRQFLIPFIRNHPERLELVYRNADFNLYRIHAGYGDSLKIAGAVP